MTPKPPPKCKTVRPRECRAVTIGLGFTCNNGVVLCADRQITVTTGMKYEKQKVSWYQVFSPERKKAKTLTAFGMTYAGDPDKAKVLAYRISQKLKNHVFRPHKGFSYDDDARGIVESCLKSKNARPDEALIAFQMKSSFGWRKPFIIRTSGTKVVLGHREYIGVGDSSVIRYFDKMVGSKIRNISQAECFGAYLVSVANGCVEGCSGGPDVLTLRSDDASGIKRNFDVGNIEDELKRLIFETLERKP